MRKEIIIDVDKEIDRLAKIEPGPWTYESLESRIENADGDRAALWWSEQEDYFVCRVRTNYPELLRRFKLLRELPWDYEREWTADDIKTLRDVLQRPEGEFKAVLG